MVAGPTSSLTGDVSSRPTDAVPRSPGHVGVSPVPLVWRHHRAAAQFSSAAPARHPSGRPVALYWCLRYLRRSVNISHTIRTRGRTTRVIRTCRESASRQLRSYRESQSHPLHLPPVGAYPSPTPLAWASTSGKIDPRKTATTARTPGRDAASTTPPWSANPPLPSAPSCINAPGGVGCVAAARCGGGGVAKRGRFG